MPKKKKSVTLKVINRETGEEDTKATQELKAKNRLFKTFFDNEQSTMGKLSNRLVTLLANDDVKVVGSLAKTVNKKIGRNHQFYRSKNPKASGAITPRSPVDY